MLHGPGAPKKEVPTLTEFAPRFVDGHTRANRHKPSGIVNTQSILKWHLIPALGAKRLDAITNEQVQKLKLALSASGAQDGEQRLDAPEHAAEEGCRVERTRPTAVHHQVVEEPQEDDGVPRLRGVRAVAGRCPESKPGNAI